MIRHITVRMEVSGSGDEEGRARGERRGLGLGLRLRRANTGNEIDAAPANRDCLWDH